VRWVSGRVRRLFEKQPSRGRALILLYHRIAEPLTDPQLLSVSPKHFEGHLEWIVRNCHPMPLGILATKMMEGDVPDRAVSITFDDGYADNLLHGKPLLDRFGTPATVFAASNPILSGREYWWDTLERVFLRPGALPDMMRINIGDTSYQQRVRPVKYDNSMFQRHRSWSVLQRKDPTDRHRTYRQTFEMLASSRPDTIERVVDVLSSWAGLDHTEDNAVLSRTDLTGLRDGGLIDIGCHTSNHAKLSLLSPEQQATEILNGKAAIEAIVKSRAIAFSYPFGGESDYDDESVRIVARAGFNYACTTSHHALRGDVDLFRLPRVIVRDWDDQAFGRWMEQCWYS
jgi:peptidoglycan/xylan/chitin deacetylase (PgdA/CDA1 family)